MPEYPPFVTLVKAEVTGIAQNYLVDVGPVRSEKVAFVQNTDGTPEQPIRSENVAFVQNTDGTPEQPIRSESVTFSQG